MELILVEPDSRERCQHVGGQRQCGYKVLDGKKYCPNHAPLYHPELRQSVQLRNFKLASYHARTKELLQSPNIKSLHDELVILRHCLEQIMNNIQTPWDFTVYGGRIESLSDKIIKTMAMAHKMEVATGKMFDEQNMMQYTDEILKHIGEEISDPEVLKRLSTRISKSTEDACQRAQATALRGLEQSGD